MVCWPPPSRPRPPPRPLPPRPPRPPWPPAPGAATSAPPTTAAAVGFSPKTLRPRLFALHAAERTRGGARERGRRDRGWERMGGGEVNTPHTSLLKKKKKKKTLSPPPPLLHPRTPGPAMAADGPIPPTAKAGIDAAFSGPAESLTEHPLRPRPPAAAYALACVPGSAGPQVFFFFFFSPPRSSVHPRPHGCSPLPWRHSGCGGGPKRGGAAVLAGAGADECVGAGRHSSYRLRFMLACV